MKDTTVQILLVEDNEVDIEAVRRAFKKHKIANPVIVARDGLEALKFMRGEAPSELRPPFLVLLDLNLPRMSGLEFLEAVRDDERLSSTIVFVLTTSKSDEDKTASYGKHVAGYMVKDNVGEDFMKLVTMLGSYWRVIEFPD